jgi:hypothetical protein
MKAELCGVRISLPDGQSYACFWDAGEPIPPPELPRIKALLRQGGKIVRRFHEKPSSALP